MVNLDQVETVTYDSYTTLVDVDSQADVLKKKVDGIENPEFVSRVWRSRNMMLTVIANDIDAYRPFYEIQKHSLRFALESFGYEVPENVRDEIRRTVYKENISVFDDVKPAMERIRDLGYDQYVISNGDPEMLDHMVEQANIGDIIQDWISGHEVGTFKPELEIYRHSAARTGTPIKNILHVSGGTMRDVWGAKNAGMQTAWLNRETKHYPREYFGQDPDLTIATIRELADELPPQ
ncbi:haloacid dehalogenase type II [halophilic archaeon]|nr:haloacid dehalogenase type II [halophilic archaeon]